MKTARISLVFSSTAFSCPSISCTHLYNGVKILSESGNRILRAKKKKVTCQ